MIWFRLVLLGLVVVFEWANAMVLDQSSLDQKLFAVASNALSDTPYYNEQLTRSLLVSGANLEARDHVGRTPLMTATHTGNRAILLILLHAGASTNAKDHQGRTAVDYAQGKQLIQLLSMFQ